MCLHIPDGIHFCDIVDVVVHLGDFLNRLLNFIAQILQSFTVLFLCELAPLNACILRRWVAGSKTAMGFRARIFGFRGWPDGTCVAGSRGRLPSSLSLWEVAPGVVVTSIFRLTPSGSGDVGGSIFRDTCTGSVTVAGTGPFSSSLMKVFFEHESRIVSVLL